MNRILALILIICLFVIASAAGYFFYQNQQFQRGTEVREQGKEKIPQDETVSWKTYSDCGVSFKYPSSNSTFKQAEQTTRTACFLDPGDISITYGFYYDQTLQRPRTFDEEMQLLESNKFETKTAVMLGNDKSVKFTAKNGQQTVIGKLPNGPIYWIISNLKPEQFDQILSTFKFLDIPQTSNQYPNAKLYTSQKLGVSFYYSTKVQDGGYSFDVKEDNNKIYVYSSNVKNYTEGQWVQVFSKDKNKSLADTINERFLKNYSPNDCRVYTSGLNLDKGGHYPSSYQAAEINVPLKPNEINEMGPAIFNKWAMCPEPYVTENGISYFLMDSNHPDKYVYFSIGQYPIESGIDQKLWQDTIKFL